MSRLCDQVLDALPSEVQRPDYERRAVQGGVVHLGVGAFHRAHQAVVFDDALRMGDLRWGVRGASLRSPDVAAQLNPQNGLYTVVVRDGDAQRARIIGALHDVMVAPDNPNALVELLASPSVHLVTLTITEKGYLLDPGTGDLNTDDSAVVHDLSNPLSPRSGVGFLCAGLALRRARGLSPFTVLSCDNLPHNGQRTRDAVLSLAALQDRRIADWIAESVQFPSTMVDRIVPATTEDDIQHLFDAHGYRDHAMVKTEPFTQWVIERFDGPSPDFSNLGVQVTDTVAPWEDAKLRLLNGSHSAIAYLGALAGHEHVSDAMAAPGFTAFVTALMDEAQATLSPPADLDLGAYRRALLQRFSNAALRHRTRQIAMDGSQKLPQRLLASVRARLAVGAPVEALALAVAAWMRWQLGRDEKGDSYAVEDPLAAQTAKVALAAHSASDLVDGLLRLKTIFGDDLPGNPHFRQALIAAVTQLFAFGAAHTVRSFADRSRS